MKKKFYLFLIILVCIFTIVLIYKNKSSINKENIKRQSNLAIIINSDGNEISSKSIPKGNYKLNKEKTHCENNGEVTSYDNVNGQVGFSFIGSDRCYLYFDYKSKNGWETILANNGGESAIKAKGNPDFSQVATTNEGMYAMEDDLGTSYYFRGAVDNNWVKFGKDSSGNDMYWRIIRINGDSSIRMIYTGITAPTESTKVVKKGTGTQIGTSAFNSSLKSSEYVGYMYTNGEQHGTSTDSTIKTTLDNWYKTTTLEIDASTKVIVLDQVFCNDRSASTSKSGPFGEISSWASTKTSYYYGTYGRILSNSSTPSPSLKCTTASDKFTVNSSKGNGVLTYPVGLITADEVMLAGADNNNGNSSYYLYTNQNYWTFSPSYIEVDLATFANLYVIDSSGYLYSNLTSDDYGVRPVISLSSEIKLSGDGTWNNVYTVS